MNRSGRRRAKEAGRSSNHVIPKTRAVKKAGRWDKQPNRTLVYV